ncbi:MAG: hypothetical protein ABXS93_06815 [Sulfurimonas sp.]
MSKKTFFKLATHLLLVFFFASSYLSASHIHLDNTCDDTDCELCIVVKNIQNIALDTASISIDFLPFETVSFAHIPFTQTTPIQKGFFSTAPPSIL